MALKMGRKSIKYKKSVAFGSNTDTDPEEPYWLMSLPKPTTERAAGARDYSRSMKKRGTHLIVKTFFPTRFRAMKETEYEEKVKEHQSEKKRGDRFKKKEKLKSFAAQRASVRRFLNDAGFRQSIADTFLDNSDAFRRKREEIEEAEPEPPTGEALEAQKKVDKDNLWIVETLQEHDTREDLEQRVIQHIMQDPEEFRVLKHTLRIAEGNRQRNRQVQKRAVCELNQAFSSLKLLTEAEMGLLQSDMQERLQDLKAMLGAAQTSEIPKYPPLSYASYSPKLSYWATDERFKRTASLQNVLINNQKGHLIPCVAVRNS